MYAWEQQTGIPGIVGALDGTHIEIRKPAKENADVYFNRKCRYSVNVQGFQQYSDFVLTVALVDYRKRFLDVEVGWPGSVGDGRVFRNSRLCNNYEEWLSPFPTKRIPTGETRNGTLIQEEVPAFILTDSAYTNSKHLVTTFKLCETRGPDGVAEALNKKLGGARYHVEHAFGIMKGRFQIFQKALQCASENIEFGIMLTSSLFVLHNFLIDVADDSQEWWEIAEVENDDGDTEGAILDDPRYHETGKTRDILMRHMQWTRSVDDDYN
jgi:hypothetical protein